MSGCKRLQKGRKRSLLYTYQLLETSNGADEESLRRAPLHHSSLRSLLRLASQVAYWRLIKVSVVVRHTYLLTVPHP